jgi:hypothetical protein
VETRGARGEVKVLWNSVAHKVSAVDLLERPLPTEASEGSARGPRITHSGGAATLFTMRPFEIVTLRVE